MRLTETILSSPWVGPLGCALLHSLWQGTAIAAALCVILRALGRSAPHARYFAACLGLLLMSLCPAVTFDVLFRAEQRGIAGLAGAPHAFYAVPEAGAMVSLTQSHGLERGLPWIVCGWLLGVIILGARALGGWALAQRMAVRGCKPAREWVRGRCAEMAVALGIRRPVIVRETSRAQVPIVMGCVRATVLLPVSAISGLPREQIEALLAHELAHILRHDYLVNLWQTLVETLLFYHPAVWWVSRRIRAERENCCDDLAIRLVGDRRAYARALTSLEQLRATSPALAASGGDLLSRIRRIAGETSMQPYRTSSMVAGAVVIALLLMPLAMTRLQASPKPTVPRAAEPPVVVQSQEPFEIQRDDVAELKARIKELEEENRQLRERAGTDVSLDAVKKYGKVRKEEKLEMDRLLKQRAELEATRNDERALLKAEKQARDLELRSSDKQKRTAELELQQADELAAKAAKIKELYGRGAISRGEADKLLRDQTDATRAADVAAKEDLLMANRSRDEKVEARARIEKEMLLDAGRAKDMKVEYENRLRKVGGLQNPRVREDKATADVDAQLRELRDQNRSLQKQLEELRAQIKELAARRKE